MRRGMLLVESMIALSILTVLGLVLLKLSLNILQPRQTMLQQTLTDAHLTFERSLAERIPFEDLVDNDSPWPAFPTTRTTTEQIGRLPRVLPDFPNGVPVFGTVTRTRIPDVNNYPIDGGSGSPDTTNPAAMKVWRVQSVITYSVGGKNYAKSRTVLRSQ